MKSALVSPAVLFLVFIITYPTPCKSLKCFECSGSKFCGRGHHDRIVDCPGKCVVTYQNVDELEKGMIVRGCYSGNNDDLKTNHIYVCSEDRCNGIQADAALIAMKHKNLKNRIDFYTEVTEKHSALACYECTPNNPDCAVDDTTLVQGCKACVVYLHSRNVNSIVRRCCKSNCGQSGIVKDKKGRKGYICSSNRCNGLGSERALLTGPTTFLTKLEPIVRAETTKTTTKITTTTSAKTIFECYECAGPDCGKEGSTMQTNCPTCMVYRNPHDQTRIERRCCWWSCGPSNTVSDYNGIETFFCTNDKCNGIGAESALSPPPTTTTTTTPIPTTTTRATTTTPRKTSFDCYECSGANCGEGTSSIQGNCPMCMVSRKPSDPTIIERRCCWWGCGAPNTVGTHNGEEAYFCNEDKCNGIGAESILSPPPTTTTTTAPSTTTTRKTALDCYECAGPECGKDGSVIQSNCPICMVYRNPTDQTKIERRCCWWGCGSPETLGTHNGLEAYFCADDKCNGPGAESALSLPITTTTITPPTTTTVTTTTRPTTMITATTTITTKTTSTTTQSTTTITTTITTTKPRKTALDCYECIGPECGKEGSTIQSNCPMCMVYRNPKDQTKIERRCCWWSCGSHDTLGTHNGLEAYFCADDKCNGPGAESVLSPPVTTTTITPPSTTTVTTTVSPTTMTTTVMTSTTTATTVTTSITTTTTARLSTTITTTPVRTTTTMSTTTTSRKTAFDCYECAGPECGKVGSVIQGNCPMCMVYRNPKDQSNCFAKIERRCCWWGCGSSNTLGTHNGLEAYFCADDKCNGPGAESALSPAVLTSTTTSATTASITTTRNIVTVTSSPPVCSLNCQNGGTPETEDGCFCYCLEHTNGRECENIECEKPDIDEEICNNENEPLCEESENFAYGCHHLCGKC